MQLAEIPIPSSPAVVAADEVLTHFSPSALVQHCHRSYLLAAALATQERIDVDAELLYVAALLHDLALEPAFDNHTLPFEDAGGHVAWVFAAGAGWPPDAVTGPPVSSSRTCAVPIRRSIRRATCSTPLPGLISVVGASSAGPSPSSPRSSPLTRG